MRNDHCRFLMLISRRLAQLHRQMKNNFDHHEEKHIGYAIPQAADVGLNLTLH